MVIFLISQFKNQLNNWMKQNQKKGTNHLDEIKKIEQKRLQRRQEMEQAKKIKEEKKAYNMASGKNVDIDFQIMIQKNKFKEKILSPHVSSAQLKLAVCVRKRPIFKKQQQNGQIDSISCANPQIKIHQPKFKVDGITKYVENHTFTFDNTFNEDEGADQLYTAALKPLIPLLINEGIVTCFAYGQTGSGKTFTMNAIQVLTVNEIFEVTKKNCKIVVSFFEIYGGRCLDLLNDKAVLNILQDKSNSIQIPGLTQTTVSSAKQLLEIMEGANANRTTHATAANDTSSRSHAICQILIKNNNNTEIGKLVLVDLAGSQRAQDTQSNNRQRRMEGAQINKSLLALKECIRAMDEKADHVPFRASKLTLILRDSFLSKQNKSKIIMIACVSPGSSSADHSLNTLRYADRLKDNSQMHQMYNQMVQNNNKRSQSLDVKKELLKDQIQKIDSSKNIGKKEENQKDLKQQPKNLIPNNKAPPKVLRKEQPKKQQTVAPKKESPVQVKKEQAKKQEKRVDKSLSTNKKNNPNSANPSSKNAPNNKPNNTSEDIAQQIEIEEIVRYSEKKKVKDDVNQMKRTMKNQNKEEYFAFQEKVTNILEEQQEVFATHMASIKQDAKLLTQQSQLISKVQGVGFIDYDIDSYVEKLQSIIKKKIKMYNLLTKKVQNFKNYLKEQDEIRHKVKETFYY